MRRYILTVHELLPRYVRMSLAGMFFHGTGLSDGQLLKPPGRHEGRWEVAEIGPSKVAPDTTRVVPIGNRTTARDRVDAVYDKSQEFFASDPTIQHFTDGYG